MRGEEARDRAAPRHAARARTLGGGARARLPTELKGAGRAHRVREDPPQPLGARVHLGERLAALRRLARKELLERQRVRVPERDRDLVDGPRHVVGRQLGRQAELVQVAVADDKHHAVWVAPLETDEQPSEAQVAGGLVQHVAAVHEMRAVVREVQVALAVPAQHGRACDVFFKVVHVALDIGAEIELLHG